MYLDGKRLFLLLAALVFIKSSRCGKNERDRLLPWMRRRKRVKRKLTTKTGLFFLVEPDAEWSASENGKELAFRRRTGRASAWKGRKNFVGSAL